MLADQGVCAIDELSSVSVCSGALLLCFSVFVGVSRTKNSKRAGVRFIFSAVSWSFHRTKTAPSSKLLGLHLLCIQIGGLNHELKLLGLGYALHM